MIGDGNKVIFWESSWLEGLRPKDIAPKIFEISRKKGGMVAQALRYHHWIAQIDTQSALTLDHLQQFSASWEKLAGVVIQPGVKDSILWKLANDGNYSAKSAYWVQFAGLTLTTFQVSIWKAWAPPSC